VPLVEVSSILFSHVRELAERQLRTVKDAVFTVDAAAGEEARTALRAAAGRAGFNVIGLIDEPVAAAIAAGAGAGGEEIVGVYDLGAGGVGFTLIDAAGDRARILAHDTDPHVSCAEIDEALADLVADAFWRETKIELRRAVVAWQRLLMACEAAKQTLATEASAEVVVEGIVDAPAPVDLRQKVARAELETASDRWSIVRSSCAVGCCSAPRSACTTCAASSRRAAARGCRSCAARSSACSSAASRSAPPPRRRWSPARRGGRRRLFESFMMCQP
jgi:molecular chaperone DnaK (HSP70)